MSFRDVIGHSMPIKILMNAIDKDCLAHAYLFIGPSGIGKKLTASCFAKAINCIEMSTDSCDKCISCKKIDKLIHPDFHIIQRDGQNIKIEQIRSLEKEASLMPYEGRYKFFIIEDAENMNIQSANALLKTLEEPPARVIIVLLASNPYYLPPTILSRCQILKFYPLSETEVRVILEEKRNIPTERASILARFSQGKIGFVDNTNPEDIINTRDGILEVFYGAKEQGFEQIIKISEELAKEREAVENFLSYLFIWFRDLMIFKATDSINLVINSDRGDNIKKYAEKITLEEIIKGIKFLKDIQYMISRNVNTRLCLENLLITMPYRS